MHLLHLVDMGLPQGQLWALDDLAVDCAADGRYEVLLRKTPAPHPLGGRAGGADGGQVERASDVSERGRP